MKGPPIRKSSYGRNISGFNIPRAFNSGDLLNLPGLDVKVVPNALITGRKYEPGFVVEVYDESFQRVGFGASHSEPQDSALIDPEDVRQAAETSEFLDRRCLYLGVLHAHFGHFLIESLSRAWAVLDRDPGITLLFYLQIAPAAINSYDPIGSRLPGFIQNVFDLLQLRNTEILFASRDLRVSELVVPRPQFTISQHGTKDLCRIYDRLSQAACALQSKDKTYPKKVYLTRRALDPSNAAARRKSVANEGDIEKVFQKLGFAVLALEGLPFVEQIQLVAGATHLAGTTGSALHMFLLNRNPALKTYAIDWRNSRTQYILDAGRGHDAAHIYCFAGRDETGRPLVDAELVASVMQNLLGDVSNGTVARGLADEADAMFTHDALGSADSRAEFNSFFAAGQESLNPFVAAIFQFLRRAQQLLIDASIDAPNTSFLDQIADSKNHNPGDTNVVIRKITAQNVEQIDNIEGHDRRELFALIVMEGFFDVESPQASLTMLDELRASSLWAPLMIAPNCLVVAQQNDLTSWREVLNYHGPNFFKAYGPFRMRPDVEFDSSQVISLRGSVVRPRVVAERPQLTA